jgi:hypothetical protein
MAAAAEVLWPHFELYTSLMLLQVLPQLLAFSDGSGVYELVYACSGSNAGETVC